MTTESLVKRNASTKFRSPAREKLGHQGHMRYRGTVMTPRGCRRNVPRAKRQPARIRSDDCNNRPFQEAGIGLELLQLCNATDGFENIEKFLHVMSRNV